MSARPPFDPSRSDGCSVPAPLRHLVPSLEEMCDLLRLECLTHDEAFYNGGTLLDFHAANAALYEAILPKLVLRYGEQHGAAWAMLWYGAVNLGWRHWGTGRTWDGRALWVEAGAEAP